MRFIFYENDALVFIIAYFCFSVIPDRGAESHYGFVIPAQAGIPLIKWPL